MAQARPGLFAGADGTLRCRWCESTPVYQDYHDNEWGFPVTDDRRLFEKLCLEGFQAGLSWLTILNKREAFRRGFADFDAERVARFGARTSSACSPTPASCGIAARSSRPSTTRSACSNCARSSARWPRMRGASSPTPRSRPQRITHAALRAMTTSPESVAMSKDLKKRGWSFVGPTTVYAFMQAMGLVNDHVEGCHARELALKARAKLKLPR